MQKGEDNKQEEYPHLRIFQLNLKYQFFYFFTWATTVTQGVERTMMSKGGIKKKKPCNTAAGVN